jgi:hypothetical protein
MSQKQFVSYGDRGFWAYDVALGIFLKHLIEVAEPHAVGLSREWLAKAVSFWRVVAGVGDYGLQIDEKWSAPHLDVFINLTGQACKLLRERVSIAADELAAWPPILDDLRIFPRGATEVFTAPIVELGMAIVALVDGSLPAAPVGTWWFFGTPEGRTTICKRE